MAHGIVLWAFFVSSSGKEESNETSRKKSTGSSERFGKGDLTGPGVGPRHVLDYSPVRSQKKPFWGPISSF